MRRAPDETDTIAGKSAEAMRAADDVLRDLGMEVLEVGAGRARLAMTVTPRMANALGVCHGGYIFTLADSAFAFACNSHGRHALAQHCAVTFLAPGRVGMRIIADATERHRAERGGLYDVTVWDDATGTVIAEFRGHARTVPGSWVETQAPE
jgi:acyl-CoA thioesterase